MQEEELMLGRKVYSTLLAGVWVGALLGAKPAMAAEVYKIGDKVSDFALKTAAGKVVKLSSMKGSPVVLAFYASW